MNFSVWKSANGAVSIYNAQCAVLRNAIGNCVNIQIQDSCQAVDIHQLVFAVKKCQHCVAFAIKIRLKRYSSGRRMKRTHVLLNWKIASTLSKWVHCCVGWSQRPNLILMSPIQSKTAFKWRGVHNARKSSVRPSRWVCSLRPVSAIFKK